MMELGSGRSRGREVDMMNRSPLQCGLLLAVGLCLVLAGQARGRSASGWQWSLVLKQDKVSDAMQMPTALFIDAGQEHYYVVDSGRNRLLSFDRKGNLLHIFNAGKGLKTPYDMVRTGNGGIWVVEKGKNSLSHIDLKARRITPATLRFHGALVYPDRLEAADSLYVLDKATGRIIAFDPGSLQARTSFACPNCAGGFVDFRIHDGMLWALDRGDRTVCRFRLDGTLEKVIPLDNRLNFPVSLAIGPSGSIYILDRHSRDIVVYDRTGRFRYRFLGRGISRGRLYYPVEIRFDPWGGLCVVDEGNARVEIFRR